MKRGFIRSVTVIVVSAVLLGSYTFIRAAWMPPTDTPPNGNVEAPLNIGTATQYKEGNLVTNITAALTEVRSNSYCNALGNNCNTTEDTSGSVQVQAGTADIVANTTTYGFEFTVTFATPFKNRPALYLTPIKTGDDEGYLSGYGSIYFTPPAGSVGHYCKPSFISGPSATGFKVQYSYMIGSFSFSSMCNIPLQVDWIAVGN